VSAFTSNGCVANDTPVLYNFQEQSIQQANTHK